MTAMVKKSIKTILTATALTATAFVYAEGEATTVEAPSYTSKWLNGDNMLEVGTTIQAVAANSSNNGYTGNPKLENKAWGMQGTWLSFEVVSAADVVVTLSSSTMNAPGMTVYRTDGPFVGTDGKGASDKAGTEGAIHSFSQVAQAGKPGLIWATDDSVMDSLEGNTTVNGIVETLGYVNGSSKDYVNFYEEQILSGAHDLSIDNRFENGVYGSVAQVGGHHATSNYANLTLVNLQPGNYTVYVAGADSDLEGAPIDVKVSSIPLSPADCLLNAQEAESPEMYPRSSAMMDAADFMSGTALTYYYRHYSENNTYLGVSSDNHLYSLSSGDTEVKDLGAIADLMPAECK
ncbi:MAG: hypothetical protein K9L22_01395 [Methylococcaceae bacterium]|nr:hypothetical protein [Methylococcaceae bacterium]